MAGGKTALNFRLISPLLVGRLMKERFSRLDFQGLPPGPGTLDERIEAGTIPLRSGGLAELEVHLDPSKVDLWAYAYQSVQRPLVRVREEITDLDAQCVLEISGTERDSELERRHREKVNQALANPLRWDAFVVVCAFSHNEHRIRFSFHRNEDSSHE